VSDPGAQVPDEREVELRDGTRVRLRPVTPADKPRFYANFAHATEEDLRNRFFEALPALPDALVSRLARYDPAREIALVAEPAPGTPGVKPLDAYGVARLSLDPGRTDTAELALIVRHDWQRRGIGRILTATLLETAVRRGVRRIWALVLRSNRPMVTLLRSFGFTIAVEEDDPMLVRGTWTAGDRGPFASGRPLG
jgi:acetyltransferase